MGRTTFTRLLVNRIVDAGGRAAILDADPGQSEIGPPACAGLAFTDARIAALSDLAPHALAFVGATSPSARIPEHITAVRRLADRAESRPLVVDTSGYLHGWGARRLLQCEYDLLNPAHVVGLQRGDELNGILAPMRRRAGCHIHTPEIPPAIGTKPSAMRTQRRALQFAAYFHDAAPAQFAFGNVAFAGTWLGSGVPVPAHVLRFLNETLGPPVRVYHAEMCGGHLGMMTNRAVVANRPEIGIVMQQLRARDVSVTVAARLKHLLVGLEASNGKLLGLGILVRLDFARAVAGLLTPVRSPDAARVLHFGLHRVAPDGSDAGALKPGEL